MRLNNFISLTQEDMSPIHEEITSIYDAFIATAADENEAKQFETMFKREYPHLIRLKDLIESILIGQQNTRNFERIKDPEAKQAKIKRFRVIKGGKLDTPDEPA